jgi:hypothetical protein
MVVATLRQRRIAKQADATDIRPAKPGGFFHARSMRPCSARCRSAGWVSSAGELIQIITQLCGLPFYHGSGWIKEKQA